MHDLSLHLLDLIENSIRAGARIVSVTISVHDGRDVLSVIVEDDGAGVETLPPEALEPHYTTKERESAGMGLALFKDTASEAGGGIVAGRSDLGGAAVIGMMRIGDMDTETFGDMAATLEAVACTNPGMDLRLRLISAGGTVELKLADAREELPESKRSPVSAARSFARKIRAEGDLLALGYGKIHSK